MNVAMKERIVSFLGDLDDTQLSFSQAMEAKALYNMLTRPPGRPKGSRKAKADTSMKEHHIGTSILLEPTDRDKQDREAAIAALEELKTAIKES